MFSLLVRFGANVAGVWAAIELVDGLSIAGGWQSLLLIALVLGVVNVLVRPLAKLLSLPLVILSLGLFILVINALMLQVVIWVTGDTLTTTGFGATFLGALVISIVSWVVTAIFTDEE